MPPLFETHRITKQVGGLRIRLELIDDFDTALAHYAHAYPRSTAMIPYYTALWPSAVALAEYIVRRFGRLDNRRVLELGCGLGLPAIVAAKMGATVLAVDAHPDNEAYLRRNVALNGITTLSYRTQRWEDLPGTRGFDVVMASDVLYETEAARSLASAMTSACATAGAILLADPGRDLLQAAVTRIGDRGFAPGITVLNDCLVVEFAGPPSVRETRAAGRRSA
jgi:predicted nicotinamide N-methyase